MFNTHAFIFFLRVYVLLCDDGGLFSIYDVECNKTKSANGIIMTCDVCVLLRT